MKTIYHLDVNENGGRERYAELYLLRDHNVALPAGLAVDIHVNGCDFCTTVKGVDLDLMADQLHTDLNALVLEPDEFDSMDWKGFEDAGWEVDCNFERPAKK